MTTTYQNPVWPGYFADPFVLRHRGVYYAYGTGPRQPEGDGRWCPVLRSRDLATWEYVGGAIQPLDDPPRTAYWAPEVAERDGTFYLYYSAADASADQDQRLRVAIADRPEGPFVDAGVQVLPDEGFTIDAHPFRDPSDGRWYLYFARDFFDGRVGTGTAVAPLRDDMLGVTEPPRVVLRANADWQIFERNRHHYDKTWDAWHTVEGPFVVRHDGRYYCFYSGGAWRSAGYGVGFGVADHPLGPFEHPAGESGPAVLQGVSGKVIGPGHNSVILGPDGATPYIVYHAWDPAHTARRMCIDPLAWTPHGPRCDGPTTTPQLL